MTIIPEDRATQADAAGAPRDLTRDLAARLHAIGQRCASLPELDAGSPDELCGYDDQGMWTN